MARLANMGAAMITVSAFVALGGGCAAEQDDGARFREALPTQEEIALRVPGNASGTATKSQGLRIATTDVGVNETARFYRLTRDMTTAVDATTAVILGGVWTIAHTTPTSIGANKAVWGPGAANALEPAVWRLTVHETERGVYDYELEGQPKAGGTWLTVLAGHGYGTARPEHKQGWLTFDNDAYRTLDPSRAHDDGKAKITYDLRQLPATIAVELRPSVEKGWADVMVTHENAGAGSVSIKGHGDMDPSKTTKLEDFDILSRWASDGSGRADALLRSGDLPLTVTATECWSTSFARVFYQDTVNAEPETGDPSRCSFPQTTLR